MIITRAGRWLSVAALLLCVLAAPARAADEAAMTAAEVGDWKIMVGDLDKAIAPQLNELERKRHDLRLQLLQELLGAHLLELEAKAQNLTREKLLDKEVDSKVPKIGDAEVKKFIEANKGMLPEGLPDLEEKVRHLLQGQSLEQARALYFGQLANKFQAKITLPSPPVQRVQVPGPFTEAKGPENAPITIVEFSDFQCPYCRRVQGTLQALDKAYPGKLRFVFRHFPLPSHNLAPKASEAALCAGDQKKFWEYHDALFQDPKWLEPAQLPELAKKLGLNEKTFGECLESNKHARRIQHDLAVGQTLGINGTPVFFINGIQQVGALPEKAFRSIIDAELAGANK